MVDIFQEVEEDLRRDRALKLWRQYGSFLIGAAVLVVVATAGYMAWRDWDRKSREAQSAQLISASDLATAGQTAEAAAAFSKLAAEGRSGSAALARLHEASLLARRGDKAQAVALYRTIANDGSVEPELRDAARLLGVLHGLDSEDPEALRREVEPLLAANSPWRHSALELQAILAARRGNDAEAKQLYTQLADDPAAPVGLRARAAEMLAALGG